MLDSFQPQVRKAAKECLDAWVEQGGLVPFVEAEIFSDALSKENPNLRADVSISQMSFSFL
jgi:hypothetical protein